MTKMADTSEPLKTNRGLASADKATRQRVAQAGGQAPHRKRGLQAADPETRERVARAGGAAPHAKRGLQAADEMTRERVARTGGEATRVSRARAVPGAGEGRQPGPKPR